MGKIAGNSLLFQRASEAVDKANFDYAIELFLQILKADPDDAKTRMALRQTEKSKFEKRGFTKAKAASAAMLGLGNLFVAWAALLFKKYDAAIMQYEKYLTRYPFSPFVLGQLAGALKRSGRDESAILALEFLRQTNPGHVRTLRHLAHIYVERNDIARAMARYQMILQVKPLDIEAGKELHNLAATESIQEGWETGEDFHDKIRDREHAARLEDSQRIIRDDQQAATAVTRVMDEIEDKPENPVLWAELGDLNRRRQEYSKAISAYEKALELDPKNRLYLSKLMDAKLLEFDGRIARAKEAVEASPEEDSLQTRLGELAKEREAFWLAELKRRVEDRPTDTALRYDLGRLYVRLGMVNEATAEFQRVVRDPKLRLGATAMLGQCFALKGLDELAIEQYERALEGSSIMEEDGKNIAYNLGVLYEKVGNYAAAETAYKKIFEIDIGYRDIAEKMEKIYKMRRQQKSSSNSEGNT